MTSMSPSGSAVGAPDASPGAVAMSPDPPPKNVAFELLFLEAPQYRARLPLRVQIFRHDSTDSIVTTVKNFYGLYAGATGSKGVSFEDKDGNTLIARYENFYNNMVVYVRVFEELVTDPTVYTYQAPHPMAQTYHPNESFHTQHPAQDHLRPASRSPTRRSQSPHSSRGRRSGSAGSAGLKRRPRSSKNRSTTSQADALSDHGNGYSSDEGAASTASGRTREQFGNTDISVENIVEGGRRKRAKFESCELPLFAPPQMPAATSNPSVSPARRMDHHRPSFSFGQSRHNPFTNPRPIQATQNYNTGIQSHPYAPNTHGYRHSRVNSAVAVNGGILPTPDPTVGSCMSEEDKDVALQLMRLGDMSNISHGRTSASTLDDTFSGKADATSSTGATSDGESDDEEELPASRRQKLDASGTSQPIYQTTEARFTLPNGVEGSGDEAEDGFQVEQRMAKAKSAPKSKTSSIPKPPSSKSSKSSTKTKKLPPVPAGPMSPSVQQPVRKQSVASSTNQQNGEDDSPDLSTKPRCQRCRKSKKGCDRQRPCGRCRDAGLTADQCVSEDEGNGRKGRFGRHMGVPVKTENAPALPQPSLLPAAPIGAPAITAADKVKKRKR